MAQSNYRDKDESERESPGPVEQKKSPARGSSCLTLNHLISFKNKLLIINVLRPSVDGNASVPNRCVGIKR